MKNKRCFNFFISGYFSEQGGMKLMLKKLDTSEANILEYHIKGNISKAENDMLLRDIQHTIDKFGEVKLLVKLDDIPLTDASGLKDRLVFAKEHLDKIEKYAVVTDMKIANAVKKLLDPLTDMEFETFPPEEENEARHWLR